MKFKLVTIVFFFLCLISCKTVSKFSRANFLKIHDSQINLENEPIDISKVFLDQNNIKSVSRDKKLKIVNIEQFHKNPKFEYLDSICKQVVTEKDYGLIYIAVINGEPILKSDFQAVKIESSAIKKITILKDAETSVLSCRNNGHVLIIQISSN